MLEIQFITPLFELGSIAATPGALALIEAGAFDPGELLARHVTGDWGDLCPEDRTQNARAVAQGLRVFSSYNLGDNKKVWVITENDRSVTTFLLPDEY